MYGNITGLFYNDLICLKRDWLDSALGETLNILLDSIRLYLFYPNKEEYIFLSHSLFCMKPSLVQ